MTEQEFKTGLTAIKKKVTELPDDQQARMYEMLRDSLRRHAILKHNCEQARSWLDDLRIALKYLVFDHEATQRERSRPHRDPGR